VKVYSREKCQKWSFAKVGFREKCQKRSFKFVPNISRFFFLLAKVSSFKEINNANYHEEIKKFKMYWQPCLFKTFIRKVYFFMLNIL